MWQCRGRDRRPQAASQSRAGALVPQAGLPCVSSQVAAVLASPPRPLEAGVDLSSWDQTHFSAAKIGVMC